MKLEYLGDISEGGEYKDVDPEELVRLFDFDPPEAQKFQDVIREKIILERESVSLAGLQFIENVNCDLILKLGTADKGLSRKETDIFICELSSSAYRRMYDVIQPFTDEDEGYCWLDLNLDGTGIDFLFSAGGGW